MNARSTLLAAGMFLLSACTWFDPPVAQPEPPRIPVKISAVGYGTVRHDLDYQPNQLQLMAQRASRMDAYRNLVEQVYGVRINGSTTVSAMAMQNDKFRGYVDGFVRGARLVRITPLGEDTYETRLEVTLDQAFFDRCNNVVKDNVDPESGTATVPGCTGLATTGCGYRSRYFYYSD